MRSTSGDQVDEFFVGGDEGWPIVFGNPLDNTSTVNLISY
jgi:hypothetical protein